MTRRPDWRRRLTVYLADVSQAVYRPGVHDPVMFVANAVLEMTGKDIAADLRGYRSDNGLAKRIKALGGIEGWLDGHLPRAARPRPGDVVLLQNGGLAIWQGSRSYGVAGNGWVLTVDSAMPQKAWSV